MYAGLRRGELMALWWHRVDLGSGLIRVERGWDDKEGEIETKGRNGRKVPIPGVLRDYLDEHRLRGGEGRAFGNGEEPFNSKTLTERADRAWRAAKLDRITLHECRHTFASLMIAAGVNAKALSTYMGHANISISLDRYGHLMPGNEEEAAGLLDAYLERANTQARLAALD
jgi:integrase